MVKQAEKILELLDNISYVDLFENIYDEVKYIRHATDKELYHALHDLLIVLEDDTNYVLSEDNSFDEIIQLLKRGLNGRFK